MRIWLVIVIALTGVVLFLLPKTTTAQMKPLKKLMVENKRTHTLQNYVMQRGRKDEMSERMDAIGPAYERRSYESDYPEDLPEMIVDYANMIRNDIILLDNSEETRTHKRGNVKKFNHAIPEPPCSCESSKELLYLGSNHIPQYVESRNCSKGSCPSPYRCIEKYYLITVLKLRSYIDDEESQLEMPEDLSDRWLAKQINVIVGCVCARDSGN